MKNLIEWDLIDSRNKSQYRAMEYRARYCDLDVIVLRDGYNYFQNSMKEITDLDTKQYPTLASVSFDHLLKKDCFKDVMQLSGIPQLFINKCNVGGRTRFICRF